MNEQQPFFLKGPHLLFSNCDLWPDCYSLPMTFKVTVNPLTVTDLSCGRIYEIPEVVVEDSSGPRMHLQTQDGCYRLEIPYYGVLPPFHGSFITRRLSGEKDEWNQDVWYCMKNGQFVALPIKTN